jgi:hypothetical protein
MNRQGADNPWFNSWQVQDIFSFSRTFILPLWLTHPAIQQISGLVLEVKQPGHKFNHLSLSHVEMKDEWSCTSAAPLHLWFRQEQFYFFTCLLMFK